MAKPTGKSIKYLGCANESIKGASYLHERTSFVYLTLSGPTNPGDYRYLGFLRRECCRWVSKRRGVVGGDRDLRLFDISPLASKIPPYGLRDLQRSPSRFVVHPGRGEGPSTWLASAHILHFFTRPAPYSSLTLEGEEYFVLALVCWEQLER